MDFSGFSKKKIRWACDLQASGLEQPDDLIAWLWQKKRNQKKINPVLNWAPVKPPPPTVQWWLIENLAWRIARSSRVASHCSNPTACWRKQIQVMSQRGHSKQNQCNSNDQKMVVLVATGNRYVLVKTLIHSPRSGSDQGQQRSQEPWKNSQHSIASSNIKVIEPWSTLIAYYCILKIKWVV